MLLGVFFYNYSDSIFYIIAILVSVKYLIVLIPVSLMANNFEHIFICLMVICMLSLEKWLFNHFYPLFNWIVFCCWIVKVIYMFLLKFLVRYIICIYFLTFHKVSFHFLHGLLWTTKLSNLMTSKLSMFSFIACALWCYV